MNLIDIVLGVILAIAFYIGFKKGLFVALASLIALIAGIIGAIYFSDYAAGMISERFEWSPLTINIVAFAVTFLGIVFTISLMGKILTKIADFAMLGFANKLFGGIFNVLKYALIISVIFVLVESTGRYQILTEEDREQSVLFGPVRDIAPTLLPNLIRQSERLTEDLFEEEPLDIDQRI
jgi:membrane protein required for colicin V production